MSKNTQDTEQKFQHYWRCKHHPSAIDNFFHSRTMCEWSCHAEELRWYHNGEHPLPKSWGGLPKTISGE